MGPLKSVLCNEVSLYVCTAGDGVHGILRHTEQMHCVFTRFCHCIVCMVQYMIVHI